MFPFFIIIIILCLLTGSYSKNSSHRRASSLLPLDGYLRLMSHKMRSQTEKTNFCKIVVPRTYLTAKECYKIKGGYTNRSIQSTRPFLISGVGRSGTTFIASLYQQVGLDIHHDHFKDCRETIQCPGRDGAVSWPQAFSDQRFHTADNNSSRQCSLSSFTWMVPNGIYFDHIIHVVRDPIKTIDSRWNKVFLISKKKILLLCANKKSSRMNHTDK